LATADKQGGKGEIGNMFILGIRWG
jgi:hypothetical protein